MQESRAIKLSVVIVNYNVQYFLEQTLLSVQKASEGLAVEVFVVDNDSSDGSVEMVRQKFPEIQLIANQHNPGFSIANNQAIAEAQGQYVLLLNPDTVVREDTFVRCVEFMDEHPDAGGLGIRMIDGTGAFLPESKRGFPSPFVAFCKAFGLSSLFPRSRVFNHYHLGYLDEHETHSVEVLSGAFMMLRKSVLDEIGLLDETFFMYGEDIDLSYRIVQAGYKNYYFPGSSIIHYKGESTKKGSLNYVRTFYQAMIIFARKHFEGEKARTFILMIQVAIYFKAFITLLGNLGKRAALPLLDAGLIFIGLYLLRDFWSMYFYQVPNHFSNRVLVVNFPMYTAIWVGAMYFSGGYDPPLNLRRLIRGLFIGTVAIAAVYGFLPMDLRSSRALILLGAIWAVLSTVILRSVRHFIRHRNLDVGRERTRNLMIVGERDESERVQQLLYKARVQRNYIGTVAPESAVDAPEYYFGKLPQLDQLVHIYKANELIFCARNVSNHAIMHWMNKLGSGMEYKIVPPGSQSIIGSSSRNTSGELYTVEVRFVIDSPMSRRNKRIFDLAATFGLLLFSPLLIWRVDRKFRFLKNGIAVLLGRKTWVGYAPVKTAGEHLPLLRPGVLSPVDALRVEVPDDVTRHRLNFFYAKDFRASHDVDIVWKGLRKLGN